MPKQIHLGVTGLRRTGKTVFLTALIYQLTQLGSRNLGAFQTRGVTLHSGRIANPQDGETKRFPYSRFLAGFREEHPQFPLPTVRESGCVLRLNYENLNPPGKLGRMKGWLGLNTTRGTILLHIHDYPGEYLLDTGLMEKKLTFAGWSTQTLDRMRTQCPQEAQRYEQAAEDVKDQTPEEISQRLRACYADYATAARRKGLEFVQPAMTLIKWYDRQEAQGVKPDPPDPEELPFVPLPGSLASHEPLVQEMQTHFHDHVEHLVRPFAKRIQRCQMQLVLVDVLRVLRNGVEAYNDTRECLAEILRAYHETWKPLRGIKRVLFAATKADHATKTDRANMTKLLDELVFQARGTLKSGIPIASSEWFTSLRATQDAQKPVDGRPLNVLTGRKKGEGAVQPYYPGPVPAQWPDEPEWVFGNDTYDFPEFEPQQLPKRNGALLPHMNLDDVLWAILEPCF